MECKNCKNYEPLPDPDEPQYRTVSNIQRYLKSIPPDFKVMFTVAPNGSPRFVAVDNPHHPNQAYVIAQKS